VSQVPFTDRLVEEASGLIEQADLQGLKARLLGGIAIRLLLGERFDPAFERRHGDIDLVTSKKSAKGLAELIEQRGWVPAREFNALNGSRRLLFHDPYGPAQIDVFVEAFEMCHRLPLADELSAPGPSLPASDLLMTKLQIIELNDKDRSDCFALLNGCAIGDASPSMIDPARIASLTAGDWGLFHTFELNFARLREGVETGVVDSTEALVIAGAIDRITEAMDSAPKSRGWRMRARIGEKKQWYDTPEEVDRD
jgi:hypothetical protein